MQGPAGFTSHPPRPAAAPGAAGQAVQFRYTERDFKRVRRLIYDRAGIALGDSKVHMVYSRLSRRVRTLGLKTIHEYLDLVERDPGPEWEAFTNALTTNLTSFFRERHHFDILREYLAQVPEGQVVKIWCAAASTGEEPYSIAMTVVEHYRSFTPPVMILASDVDTQVLATASAGIYPLERTETLEKRQVRLFFRRGAGAHEGSVRVVDPLKKLIRFTPLNLLDDGWPIKGPLDAIFCRNVMIYFDKATQRTILQKFAPLLKPEGLLFAGHSESFTQAADLFRACGRTTFQLIGESA
jgi:chemotaxis protein methyltransferase CheR